MSETNGHAPVELNRKYRPKAFKSVVGQDQAVRVLTDFLESGRVPHAVLFAGPSGVGKTTLARIMARKLGCADEEFQEINAASARGIDTVREVRQRMGLSPIFGKCRVYLWDEAAKLTGDAQTGLLKMLEDTPRHVYFMLATTDPHKLIKTIHTRCTRIELKPLKEDHLKELVNQVLTKEGKEISPGVLSKLVTSAEGSARQVLTSLHKIIGLATPGEQLAALQADPESPQAIAIAQALMDNRTNWKTMASVLKSVDEEPETLRHMILGYASRTLLGGKRNERAALILREFGGHFYDSKKAGLIAACYEIVGGK